MKTPLADENIPKISLPVTYVNFLIENLRLNEDTAEPLDYLMAQEIKSGRDEFLIKAFKDLESKDRSE